MKRTHDSLDWCTCPTCDSRWSLCSICNECIQEHPLSRTDHQPKIMCRDTCISAPRALCTCEKCQHRTPFCRLCNTCTHLPAIKDDSERLHYHTPDVTSYKCRAECIGDVLKGLKKLNEKGICVLDIKIQESYSFDSQMPCDVEFTFSVLKNVPMNQLVTILDWNDHCQCMAATLKPKEEYTGNKILLHLEEPPEGYWFGPYDVLVPNSVDSVPDEDGGNVFHRDGSISETFIENKMTKDEWINTFVKFDEQGRPCYVLK